MCAYGRSEVPAEDLRRLDGRRPWLALLVMAASSVPEFHPHLQTRPRRAAAAEFAAWEAHRRGLPLRLVHAMEPPPVFGPGGAGAGWLIDAMVRDCAKLLGDVTEQIQQRYPELAIGHAVLTAGPAAALVAESARASLVVVGARGVGGFPELLAGSVTTQLAAHAHAPVVVVRTEAGAEAVLPDGPVVVGVDGSDESAAAVGFAFEEAQARNVGLTAVYAWDILPSHNLGPATSSHYEPWQAQQEADRLVAEAVAGWAEKYPDIKIGRHAIHTLSPAAVLRDSAAGAGLLVVGSRGRGGFTGLLLGSVSRAVVSHARCSVAVIHEH